MAFFPQMKRAEENQVYEKVFKSSYGADRQVWDICYLFLSSHHVKYVHELIHSCFVPRLLPHQALSPTSKFCIFI